MAVSLPNQIDIKAPPSKVWAFIADPANYTVMNPSLLENGPATTTPATATTPEQHAWTAVEAPPILWGLYTPRVALKIVSTLQEPGKVLVHDIDASSTKIRVTYVVEEGAEEGTTVLRDTIVVETAWLIRGIAVEAARAGQAKRSLMVKDALEGR